MLTCSFHFLQFNNLSVFPKNPSLTQFIPEIYNKFIIKIIRYFWGVTSCRRGGGEVGEKKKEKEQIEEKKIVSKILKHID